MKQLYTLTLLILSLVANATDSTQLSAEVQLFGLSYHDNRDYNFNEVNPGIGLTLLAGPRADDSILLKPQFTLSVGTYKDSYSEQAAYILGGLRFTLGDTDDFHVSLGASCGYLNGSHREGYVVIPNVSVGYSRISIGVTGDTTLKPSESNRREPDYSNMVACFLNIRVWEN